MQRENCHLLVSCCKFPRVKNVRQLAFCVSFEWNSLAKCTTRRFFWSVRLPVRQISICSFVSIACDKDNSSWSFFFGNFNFLPAIFFERTILDKRMEKKSMWKVVDNLDGVCEIQPVYRVINNSCISYENIDRKTLCCNIICCARNRCFQRML